MRVKKIKKWKQQKTVLHQRYFISWPALRSKFTSIRPISYWIILKGTLPLRGHSVDLFYCQEVATIICLHREERDKIIWSVRWWRLIGFILVIRLFNCHLNCVIPEQKTPLGPQGTHIILCLVPHVKQQYCAVELVATATTVAL